MLDLKMPDLNNVTIVGNLTNDPTFRKTTNGTPVANFYIASNRKFKDHTGQWRENVCYVGVVAWYKLAESCYEYLKKGSAVLIEGELQSRIWKNNDGSNKNVVEIKARRIQFLNRQFQKDETIGLHENEEFITDTKFELPEDALKRSENIEVQKEDIKDESIPEQEIPDTSEFDFGYEDLKF